MTETETRTAAEQMAAAAMDAGITPNELRGPYSASLRASVQAAAGTGTVAAGGWTDALAALDLALERAVRATGKLTRCGSCDQPVRWVLTVKGQRMPLDPLPHPMGNVVFAIEASKSVVQVVPNKELPVAAMSFRAHFATCPDAGQRRSKVHKILPPRCAACGMAMDRALFATGERTHPCC